MIRCYECPLQDICSVASGKLDVARGMKVPLVLNFIGDSEKDICPLCRCVKKEEDSDSKRTTHKV